MQSTAKIIPRNVLACLALLLLNSRITALAQSSSEAGGSLPSILPPPNLIEAASLPELDFNTTSSLAPSSCIRLTNTQTCPGQEGRLVRTSPTFYNSTSSFDVFMATQNYDTSPSYVASFQSAYTCPGFFGGGQRYHISFFCAWIVEASAPTCIDPTITPASPPPRRLCRDTCISARDSLVAVYSDPTICTPPTPEIKTVRVDMISKYTALCATLPAATSPSGQTTDCDTGMLPQEINTCGFFLAADARRFCAAGSTDLCCTRVTDPTTGLPAGNGKRGSGPGGMGIAALAGIVVACVVVVGALIIILIRRRRVQQRKENHKRANVRRSPLPHLNTASNHYTRTRSHSGSTATTNTPHTSSPLMSPTPTPSSSSMAHLRSPINNSPLYSTPPSFPLPSLPRPSSSPATDILSLAGTTLTRDGTSRFGDVNGSSLDTLSPLQASNAAAAANGNGRISASSEGVTNRMRVWAEYVPLLDDEVELRVGDVVEIFETFSDGWATGQNSSRPGTIGVFPLACLIVPTPDSPRDGRGLGRVTSMNWGQRRSSDAVRIN
ncbi:hypothetical protein DFJ77DRAFT_279690 [Powellomyces hirtus]|nr:hypothetical protein DFJ77DRAFT_279690 [Powellomyces hirtus]